ncbi:MAG: hypothetical protein ACTSSH_03640 [Candidatus Heimdallarchaeota archaeon]
MTDTWYIIKRGLHCIVLLVINVLAAIYNPVTTFCINDVRTRNFSRIVEGITAGMILVYLVLLLLPKLELVNLILDCLLIVLQMVLVIYIVVLVNPNIMIYCGFYTSAKVGISLAAITIFSRGIEIVNYFVMNKGKRVATKLEILEG